MTHETPQTGRFQDLGLPDTMLAILNKKEFVTPTPIQARIIPTALSGRDVVGIAQTGTGKTFAFGIPMLVRLQQMKKQGLVLVPTRELAEQVYQSLSLLGNPMGLKMAVVIGGASRHAQVKAIRSNPHIVMATPGRLVDLLGENDFKLNNIGMITFDEADRMLDMGFLPQIKRILETAPKERQTMLFSATMPSSIEKLLKQFMKDPYRVDIAPQGTTSERIEQEMFIIPTKQRMRMVDALLTEYSDETVLIFSRTKFGAKRIARDIRNMGHTSAEIHSNRSQAQRKLALAGFASKKYRVLVATDIAARGIDVKHIALVINYDLPENLEDYVHRIGRTGRAGKHGKAISFAAPSERGKIKQIERMMRKSISILPLPELPPEREKTVQSDRPERAYRAQSGRSPGSFGSKQKRKPFERHSSQSERPAYAEKTRKPYRSSTPRSTSPRVSSTNSFSRFSERGARSIDRSAQVRSGRGSYRSAGATGVREDRQRSTKRSYRSTNSFESTDQSSRPRSPHTRSHRDNDFGAARRKNRKRGAKAGFRR